MAAAETAAYMLIFRETTPEVYAEMSDGERRMHLDRWNGWCDDIAAAGQMMAGHPLADGGTVISARAGKRPIDGPFAEAKELVGGYIIVDVSGLDEATAIAERCPLLPFGMTVEVRPVAGACHLARSLGWETMREPAAS